MKALKWTNRIVTTVLYLLLTLLLVFLLISKITGSPTIFGYEFKTVLSGSMEPTFKTGSIIAIKPVKQAPGKLKKGQIISFKEAANDEAVITHRIYKVTADHGATAYETKGDNNDGKDPGVVTADRVAGVYSGLTIPYIGYLFHFITTKWGSVIFLIVPGLLLIIGSFITIWREVMKLDKNRSQPQKNPTDREPPAITKLTD
ncbi:signal peptidase I SipW [Camelliibacillus cellulosilyticus]|uniref:Signal peptidase I n=1 Tax=Camelliibacillus cellulosilyticus TaxID=2174486 RepID=A0ABV9GH19_9BACL